MFDSMKPELKEGHPTPTHAIKPHEWGTRLAVPI
jgi:hypothetical protein